MIVCFFCRTSPLLLILANKYKENRVCKNSMSPHINNNQFLLSTIVLLHWHIQLLRCSSQTHESVNGATNGGPDSSVRSWVWAGRQALVSVRESWTSYRIRELQNIWHIHSHIWINKPSIIYITIYTDPAILIYIYI